MIFLYGQSSSNSSSGWRWRVKRNPLIARMVPRCFLGGIFCWFVSVTGWSGHLNNFCKDQVIIQLGHDEWDHWIHLWVFQCIKLWKYPSKRKKRAPGLLDLFRDGFYSPERLENTVPTYGYSPMSQKLVINPCQWPESPGQMVAAWPSGLRPRKVWKVWRCTVEASNLAPDT